MLTCGVGLGILSFVPRESIWYSWILLLLLSSDLFRGIWARRSSRKLRQSRLCQKKKEQSHLSKSSNRKVGKSQGKRERSGSEREHGEERVESTAKEGRFRGEEGEQAKRRSRRKHQRVSGCKSSPGGSGHSWFHSKSGQTQNGKGGWEKKGWLIRQSKMSQDDS